MKNNQDQSICNRQSSRKYGKKTGAGSVELVKRSRPTPVRLGGLDFFDLRRTKGALDSADANAGFFGYFARDTLRTTASRSAFRFCAILSRNLPPRFQQSSISPDVFVALVFREVDLVERSCDNTRQIRGGSPLKKPEKNPPPRVKRRAIKIEAG